MFDVCVFAVFPSIEGEFFNAGRLCFHWRQFTFFHFFSLLVYPLTDIFIIEVVLLDHAIVPLDHLVAADFDEFFDYFLQIIFYLTMIVYLIWLDTTEQLVNRYE